MFCSVLFLLWVNCDLYWPFDYFQCRPFYISNIQKIRLVLKPSYQDCLLHIICNMHMRNLTCVAINKYKCIINSYQNSQVSQTYKLTLPFQNTSIVFFLPFWCFEMKEYSFFFNTFKFKQEVDLRLVRVHLPQQGKAHMLVPPAILASVYQPVNTTPCCQA